MKQHRRIFSRNDPTVLRIHPTLAQEIGLNESILLLQVDYLISISSEQGKPIARDGVRWTYQSLRDLKRRWFGFWSVQTIGRGLASLKKQGLIFLTDKYNAHDYDKTQWMALNPQGFGALKSVTLHMVDSSGTGLIQNGTGLFQDGTTIPETSSDIDNVSLRGSEKYQDLLNAVLIVCKKLDPLALSEPDYEQVDMLLAMKIEPGQIREHYAGDECWWFTEFWKGKKRQWPTPKDIRETIGQALGAGDLPPVVGAGRQIKTTETDRYLQDNQPEPEIVVDDWRL